MINSLVSLHWAEICRLDNPKSALANNHVHCSGVQHSAVHASEVSLAGFRWEDRAQRQDGAANREGKIIRIAKTKSGRKRKVTTSVSVLKNYISKKIKINHH